ncbi:ArsR family transcriptional regulator [Halobellus sp. Atlit-31R]|nr:ArsR family transcriptional regulator [Halobellus sp. Atlit-31R]
MVPESAESTAESGELNEQTQAALTALSDPKCRAILASTSEQALTAQELSERLELPLSTVYRKLDHLRAIPLLEEAVQFSTGGKHPHQYACSIDQVQVTISPQGQHATDVGVTFE